KGLERNPSTERRRFPLRNRGVAPESGKLRPYGSWNGSRLATPVHDAPALFCARSIRPGSFADVAGGRWISERGSGAVNGSGLIEWHDPVAEAKWGITGRFPPLSYRPPNRSPGAGRSFSTSRRKRNR